MAVGWKGKIDITTNQSVSTGVVSTYQIPASLSQTMDYAAGTSAGKADLLHAAQYSLAGSVQTINLQSLLDLSGATVNMARVREIVIRMRSVTSGHVLTIDTTVSNGFKVLGDGTTGIKQKLYANAASSTVFNTFWWQDKDSVGASTGGFTGSTSKNIALDPRANTFTVDVMILGCTATS